jgi:hypothetical protein
MSVASNIVIGVKETSEAAVMRAALEEHYARHPEARPGLADIAITTAALEGNPLTADPDRIRRAAIEIAAAHPEPEDVLLWAGARTCRSGQ